MSRTFMIHGLNDSTTQQPDRPVVRWLNAIRADLYTELAIRYVKHSHHVICHPSCNRHIELL